MFDSTRILARFEPILFTIFRILFSRSTMTRTPSKPNLNWPNSLWRITADAGLNFGRLEESIETDLLIVGAGYTGLSTALHAIEKLMTSSLLIRRSPDGAARVAMAVRCTPSGKASFKP